MLSYLVGGTEWQARAGPVISQYLLSWYPALTELSAGDYQSSPLLVKHLIHLELLNCTGDQGGESPGAWSWGINSWEETYFYHQTSTTTTRAGCSCCWRAAGHWGVIILMWFIIVSVLLHIILNQSNNKTNPQNTTLNYCFKASKTRPDPNCFPENWFLKSNVNKLLW